MVYLLQLSVVGDEIMSQIAPLGPIYQAGTLSGNPLSMASGLAMLSILEADDSFYQNLSDNTEYLVNGIVAAANTIMFQ